MWWCCLMVASRFIVSAVAGRLLSMGECKEWQLGSAVLPAGFRLAVEAEERTGMDRVSFMEAAEKIWEGRTPAEKYVMDWLQSAPPRVGEVATVGVGRDIRAVREEIG